MDNTKKYDLFILSVSVIDSIVEFEGTFPITEGECRDVPSFSLEPGGEGNTLIAFSRLGGKAIPVGTCGSDSYGDFLKGALHAEGVDTLGLFNAPDYNCAVSTCIYSSDGKHTFLTCEPRHTFHHKEEAFALLDQCKVLFLTGYNLYDDHLVFGNFGVELIKHAHENSIKVFFDVSPLVTRIKPGSMKTILDLASVVTMNDEEAELILGTKGVEENALTLSKEHDAIFLVKAGGKGCYIAKSGEGFWCEGFPVDPVDTMGCGDSFNAGFLYGWTKGWELKHCAALGNAEGAVKALKKGTGRKVPTFDEVVSMLEKNGYHISDESKENRRLTEKDLTK